MAQKSVNLYHKNWANNLYHQTLSDEGRKSCNYGGHPNGPLLRAFKVKENNNIINLLLNKNNSKKLVNDKKK